MIFRITQRKVEVKQDVRDYAEKKLQKLEKYFNKESTANITFSEIRENKVIEVTVNHSGLYFRAEEKAKDYNFAIDKIVDILERQIRKHKTKLEKRLRDDAYNDIPVYEEVVEYDIIRRKNIEAKPYSVDEAILQMELLGHKFFFFKNVDEGDAYCVVYMRQDGGYGILVS